ncbi:hypothetical protein SLEP1_g4991 [Rubroshorea leprosula]|uniref:Uncharacterized protein n=1 Tax=Rubroshorea leprosula TaxID=152421 RepID=A0AAV5HZE2_9ROSI|nr:hypothetical protein SLEP1_g4991 [Rubroshorea leprosula]
MARGNSVTCLSEAPRINSCRMEGIDPTRSFVKDVKHLGIQVGAAVVTPNDGI